MASTTPLDTTAAMPPAPNARTAETAHAPDSVPAPETAAAAHVAASEGDTLERTHASGSAAATAAHGPAPAVPGSSPATGAAAARAAGDAAARAAGDAAARAAGDAAEQAAAAVEQPAGPSFATLFHQAVSDARTAVRWNPLGRVDDFVFQPSTWRARQAALRARPDSQVVTITLIEALLIAQDILTPGYYAANKIFGNGRVQNGWRSSTNGPLADNRLEQSGDHLVRRSAGGLIPALAGVATQIGAAVGTAIGLAVDTLTEKPPVQGNATPRPSQAAWYAAQGARLGAFVGLAITQASVGINLVVKSVLALQSLSLTMPPVVFFLAVNWAMMRFESAVRPWNYGDAPPPQASAEAQTPPDAEGSAELREPTTAAEGSERAAEADGSRPETAETGATDGSRPETGATVAPPAVDAAVPEAGERPDTVTPTGLAAA